MYNYLNNNIISIIEQVDLKHEFKAQLAKRIEEYINKLYYKLKQTKNIIFRNEPVDFYRNYIPLTLVNNKRNIRVTDSEKLFSKYEKIGIIGAAGSGKTTLLKYLALSSLEHNFKIPIFIELRNYSAYKKGFEDFVASQIDCDLIKPVKSLFESGLFIFIFDGYDEINYIQDSNLINQIDQFISRYYQNYFIISSRPGTNLESINPLFIFQIEPLNKNDIFLFIDRLEISSDIKRNVYKSIEEDNAMKDLLSIPLFLAFYIITFNKNEPITQKSVFFRNIIDLLFSQHDSISKLGYVREKMSNLDKDSLERIASTLAFRMFFASKFQLTKDDLFNEFERIKKITKNHFENDKLLFDFTITTNILVKTENYYSFPHILILEFLSAIFICHLNSNVKKDFYSKMNANNKVLYSISFYSFLYELDRTDFIKYYLLTNLKSILFDNNIDYLSEESHKLDIIKKFINTRLLSNGGDYIPYHQLEELYVELTEETESNDMLDSLFDIV